MKGTLKPLQKGDTFAPLLILCRDKNTWFIFIASSVIFGSSYFISSTAGNKILVDVGGMSALHASVVVTVFAIIIAVNNIFGPFILKLLGDRRKRIMILAGSFHLTGTVLCALAFYLHLNRIFIIAGFIMIAIPAGLFAIYCTVIKELHPPQYTGLAVAILNFFAFVAIAGCGNIAGAVFARFESGSINGAVHYPPLAYAIIFSVLGFFAACGFVSSMLLPETKPEEEAQQ